MSGGKLKHKIEETSEEDPQTAANKEQKVATVEQYRGDGSAANGFNIIPEEAPFAASTQVLALRARRNVKGDITGLRVLICHFSRYYIVANRDAGEYGARGRPSGNWSVRPLPEEISADQPAVDFSLLPPVEYPPDHCPSQWLNPIVAYIQGGFEVGKGEWIGHLNATLPSQRHAQPNEYHRILSTYGHRDSDIDTEDRLNLSACSGDTEFELTQSLAKEWTEQLRLSIDNQQLDFAPEMIPDPSWDEDDRSENLIEYHKRVNEDAIQFGKVNFVVEGIRVQRPLLGQAIETHSQLPRDLANIVTEYLVPTPPSSHELRQLRLQIWKQSLLPSCLINPEELRTKRFQRFMAHFGIFDQLA